jgi:hypothetical protein
MNRNQYFQITGPRDLASTTDETGPERIPPFDNVNESSAVGSEMALVTGYAVKGAGIEMDAGLPWLRLCSC